MIECLTLLLGHPILFLFILISLLVFIGMTYEFILKLFGRKSIVEKDDGKNEMNNEPEVQVDEFIYDNKRNGRY